MSKAGASGRNSDSGRSSDVKNPLNSATKSEKYEGDTFLDKVEPKSCITKIDQFVSNIVKCIPIIPYIVGTFQIPDSMLTRFYSKDANWKDIFARLHAKSEKNFFDDLRLKAVLNPRTIWDTLTFNWTRYLDGDEEEEVNIKEQLSEEFVNIGLLSALISTICFSMVQVITDGDEWEMDVGGTLYLVGWLTSAIFTIASTISAVFFSLAMSETANTSELRFFLELIDYLTLTTGTRAPIILLYGGVIFCFMGLIGVAIKYFDLAGTLSFCACLLVSLASFVLFHLAMVQTLYAARKAGKYTRFKTKQVNLSVDQIKHYLESFVEAKAGGSSLEKLHCSTEDFVNFIISRSLDVKGNVDSDFKLGINPGAIGAEPVLKHDPGTLKLVKNFGDTLTAFSEKRAKALFELFLTANFFEEVKVSNFDPKKYTHLMKHYFD